MVRKTIFRKSFFMAFGITVIIALVLLLFVNRKQPPVLLCKSTVVLEVDAKRDKAVIFEKNKDLLVHPASITKLASLYLVFQGIEEGALSLTTNVTISENAVSTLASKAGLKVGMTYSVDMLIRCALLPSGSDAVIALAEHLSGNTDLFVGEMNELADTLGLSQTHFTNCVGLDEENHLTTAYDIALLTESLIKNYPQILEYSSLRKDILVHGDGSETPLFNTNDMLGVLGVNGLKTGSSPLAGYSIVLTTANKEAEIQKVIVITGSESLELRRYDCNLLLDFYGERN